MPSSSSTSNLTSTSTSGMFLSTSATSARSASLRSGSTSASVSSGRPLSWATLVMACRLRPRARRCLSDRCGSMRRLESWNQSPCVSSCQKSRMLIVDVTNRWSMDRLRRPWRSTGQPSRTTRRSSRRLTGTLSRRRCAYRRVFTLRISGTWSPWFLTNWSLTALCRRSSSAAWALRGGTLSWNSFAEARMPGRYLGAVFSCSWR
mmetsp:Transcript_3498/g.11680  ORF Transcript_3498/g.11680 Transcript_3498/m.11680 type:complete len:205 (+) Transcript_3498:623-1237(+)